MTKRNRKRLLLLPLLAALTACGSGPGAAETAAVTAPPPAAATTTPPPAASARPALPLPEASGVLTQENEKAALDWSNTADGYVMARRTAQTDKKWKARILGPATEYTYDLYPGQWTVYPLSDGDGAYTVTLYENVEGISYAAVLTANFNVTLQSPFAPFLRPDQYVDYTHSPETLKRASELCQGATGAKEKVERICRWAAESLDYDEERSETVQSGYLPDLDAVLAEAKGICLDYAALTTAMLRSQGIPCKLVVGYAGKAYHAWIGVWNGRSWERRDPTFAASGKDVSDVVYTEKFFY